MKSFLVTAIRVFGPDPVWSFLLGLGVVLGFIGPFGTFEAMSFWVRLAYWVPLVMSSNVFVNWSHRSIDRHLPNAGPLVCQFAQVATFTLTFGPFVWLYSGVFSPAIVNFESLVFITLNVFGVTVAVGLLVYYMTRETVEDDQTPVLPRLSARLPETATSPIVRLTVDDHYVEVHLKDDTCHRLLMRLSDAVVEMDAVPGFYTHRSHWVAVASVVDGLREKNREYLVMETGAKIPVSKTYRATVQAAGFL